MTVLSLIPLILACCSLVAIVLGIARWLVRVDQNTKATEKLTQAFQIFTDKIQDILFDHEKRIAHLEGKQDAEKS